MEIQSDFSELLALLNEHNVEYVVVGAHALAYHGVPRYTGDLDVLVRPSKENADRILRALDQFGFGSLQLTSDDFVIDDQVVQLGRPPLRVDFLTSLSGVTWTEAIDGSEEGKYGELPTRYLGRNEFIKNKRALGRTKDLADIEALGDDA